MGEAIKNQVKQIGFLETSMREYGPDTLDNSPFSFKDKNLIETL